MKYTHRFRVRAPLKDVARFHAESSSMAAITPPPIGVRIEKAPTVLRDGERMAFTLGLGTLPLRVRWVARMSDVGPNGFTDTQEDGPYGSWMHRHTFVPVEPHITEVVDEVSVTLRKHLGWGAVGAAMWLGMPLLFAYRGWKTRRLLEKRA